MPKQEHVAENVGVYSGIASIEECDSEDVYCIAIPDTGNFVANGMVIANCDALRYAICTRFPQGEIDIIDEDKSIDQLRREIYGDNDFGSGFYGGAGGYH
jgi:hypothetical protein